MEIKLNTDNLTEQERDTLLGLVEKANKQKVWKPKKDERCWYVNVGGTAHHFDFAENHAHRKNMIAIGNCFRTREEAEFAVEKLKVIAELRRFAEEHNEPIDWKNIHEAKHYLIYYCSGDEVTSDFWGDVRYPSMSFSSREIAQSAIDTIGVDRLKKYYFEVEE